MEEKFPHNAYWQFFLWGVTSSLGVTVSTFIDAVLVGNFVGSDGLAAVNIATPVFLLLLTLAVTIGLGANILIGKNLGNSQLTEANKIFNVQVFLALAAGLTAALAGLIFRDQLITLLGARGTLFEHEKNYLTVIILCAPIFITYQVLAASIRTDAEPRLVAISAAVVIVTNLTLDLVFMRGLQMGIFGAAFSLCIAETLGLCVLLTHFFGKKSLLRFKWTKPDCATFKAILENGFGVGSAYIFQAIVMVVFNLLLVSKTGANGVLNVALFGVIYTVSTIPTAFSEGAANAISPVVSIFAGERDCRSIWSVLRLAVKSVSASGIAAAVVIFAFAKQIIMFFGISDGTFLPTAVLCFRLYAISAAFSGINSAAIAFWQTIGRSKLAGLMSLLRNFVLMLAVGSVLILRLGTVALGTAYLCSEALCFIITLIIALTKGSKPYIAAKYRPADRTFEQYYLIGSESIEQISKDIGALCDEWDIDPKRNLFINLVTEELIMNIVRLGLRDSKEQCYVSIKLLESEGEYTVRIRDNVRTYNPFESSGDDIDNAVIKMIKVKTKYCEYQRKLTFNYLYFVM